MGPLSSRRPRRAAHRATIAIIATIAAAGSPTALRAAAAAEPSGPVRLGEVKSGSLLFRTVETDRYLPAPAVGTDVRVRITGMAATVTVRQEFFNPTQRWLEGVYLFPLGEDGAVDRMRIEAGGRVIEGRIAERDAARRTYQQAVSEGRRAGLVEQERPNMFTASVANIAPEEVVSVEIRYREVLRYADGTFRFRFPMVVGPRYIPAQRTVDLVSGPGGFAPVSARVEDAGRIAAPVLDPALGKVNPVKIAIELDAGFPLAAVESAFHAVDVTGHGASRARIALADGPVPADRDFELVWTPKTGEAPAAGVFRETMDGADYLLVMILPPANAAETPVPPRDVTLIIDTSGSMHGPSIAQATGAMALALDRLTPTDRFNVIEFNSVTRHLFEAPRPADSGNLAQAHAYLKRLRADGGTEMLGAIRFALDGTADPSRLRQVILATDGAVGNEAELFREIVRGLGDRRLFTIGIGSAPNGYFLTRAAQVGRGTHTHIGKLAEVGERMAALFAKLERPALTDIAAAWPAPAVEMLPVRVPDLYEGEPVVLVARVPGGLGDAPGALRLSGRRGEARWEHALPLAGGRSEDGIARLWGRARIADLMASLRLGADTAEVRREVLETALRFHLMSRYTSLVAVDKTPARPEGEVVLRRLVGLNLPEGWSYEKIFGDLLPPSQPPGAPLLDAALPGDGALPVMPASAAPALRQAAPAGQTVPLPQGATPMALHALAGSAALVLLVVVLAWRRRHG